MNIFIVPANATLNAHTAICCGEAAHTGKLMSTMRECVCHMSWEIIICNFLRFRFHCCQFPCWRQFPLYQLNYMESVRQNTSKRWHQRVQSHALGMTLTSHSKPINFNQSSRLIGTWKDFSVIIHAKLSPVNILKMIPLHGIHPLFYINS